MINKKLIIIVIFSLIIMSSLINSANANFQPAENRIAIISPSYRPDKQYNWMNSTIELEIAAVYVKEGLTEPPIIRFISYSLDGQPLVHLKNLKVSNSNYTIYNQTLIGYSTITTLENLSEGNHTIEAYANDMSTSRSFIVDSHYTNPYMEILSPKEQTYTGNVPLVFKVNVNFKEVRYFMYEKVDKVRAEKNDYVTFKRQISGNMTLEDLAEAPNGDYVIAVIIITDKGECINALSSFSLFNGTLPTVFESPVITVASVAFACMAFTCMTFTCMTLVAFKRHKHKALQPIRNDTAGEQTL